MQNADAFGLSSTPAKASAFCFDLAQRLFHCFARSYADGCRCIGDDPWRKQPSITWNGDTPLLKKKLKRLYIMAPPTILRSPTLSIIADEVQHNRRLVERFSKLGAH
jgi:hypothetical protein